ncbi:MAG: NADH-quinone oxidoreductase subunit NuoE [Firmicutes bacterium]|nr:NADH-quinone oxidoreductase subunit NuoE [Bacillota bacterium]MCG2760665.1 NADH-quinone oxidoreductase subunit NuoE [Candidatus Delongbacteria bacterium]
MNTNVNDQMKNEEKNKLVKEIVARHMHSKGALIPVLHEVQESYGYLPDEIQEKIAKEMNISKSEVFGVISFYSHFATKPAGKYKISVCMGTACYVKGAGAVLDKLKETLRVKVGQTTEDGEFTLEECRCLGCCGLAPVLTVNGKVYGRLTIDDVDTILESYKKDGGIA